MSATCPHCSAEIERLPGFVPDATLKERLKKQGEAKDAEIALLKQRATELDTKATEYDALKSQFETLQKEHTSFTTRATHTEALRTAGLNPEFLPSVEALHNSAMASLDEGERTTLVEWLEGAGREHPLLAPHFAAGAAPAGSGQPSGQASPPSPPRPRIPPEGGQPPPVGSARMTPDQTRAYFNSEQFQRLPRAEKDAKIAELRAAVNPGA